ncbi:hypothetical protein DRQ07_11060, partial [candidate division KSB1 bacterium]
MDYSVLDKPDKGEKIRIENGKISVPDNTIIPFIEGDGTGPDIWRATKTVLDAAVKKAYNGKKKIEWFQIYAGLSALKKYGNDNILPDDTLNAIREYKVAIKGPLTTPVGKFEYVCLECAKEQNGINGERPKTCIKCGSEFVTPKFRSLNVQLRQKLDLYACVRPVRWYKGVPCPVKEPEKLDVIIFRENTEDVYAGIEFQQGSEHAEKLLLFLKETLGKNIRNDSGIGIKPISVTGTERLVRKAIDYAIQNNKPNVTLVHKGNIMKFTEGAFRDWGYELAKREYRDQII